MRCASVTTIYGFAVTGTGTARASFEGLTVGAEGATSCTVAQYVVLGQSEYENAIASPFRLSLAEAGAISSAILLVWAVGFGIRMFIRAVNIPEISITNED
jgi:hypothetical protein